MPRWRRCLMMVATLRNRCCNESRPPPCGHKITTVKICSSNRMVTLLEREKLKIQVTFLALGVEQRNCEYRLEATLHRIISRATEREKHFIFFLIAIHRAKLIIAMGKRAESPPPLLVAHLLKYESGQQSGNVKRFTRVERRTETMKCKQRDPYNIATICAANHPAIKMDTEMELFYFKKAIVWLNSTHVCTQRLIVDI